MKIYTIEEIMRKYEKLPLSEKQIVLERAFDLFISNKAGTKSYAIAKSMGYIYQDNGSYIK